MSKTNIICSQCGKTFASSTGHGMMAFCRVCRTERNKDLVTYIDSQGEVSHFNTAWAGEAILAGCDMLSVRLDLHNVLDTLSQDTKLPIPPRFICVISYVGSLTTTRISAQQDIQKRITHGQIHCGFLVYKRGPHKATEKEKNAFQAAGSKAWVNRHLPMDEKSPFTCFIDDGYDHYASVKSLNLPYLDAIHFNPKTDNLCTILKEITKSHTVLTKE